MKIKTNYVPDNAKTYLTVGKEYTKCIEQIDNEYTDRFVSDDTFYIIDDAGDKILVGVKECEHLDNRAWEICDASE